MPYDPSKSTEGLVFLNGYLGANRYVFSSPDHLNVNDIVPSPIPLLEQISKITGQDVAFDNSDLGLPRQYWTLTRDVFTGAGFPNFLPDIPPSPVDPTFSNRTPLLLLLLQKDVQLTRLG
jgi:hypothetical protein